MCWAKVPPAKPPTIVKGIMRAGLSRINTASAAPIKAPAKIDQNRLVKTLSLDGNIVTINEGKRCLV